MKRYLHFQSRVLIIARCTCPRQGILSIFVSIGPDVVRGYLIERSYLDTTSPILLALVVDFLQCHGEPAVIAKQE